DYYCCSYTTSSTFIF
nr:immunoglobulin light chain junction region [Macaca mulatta]MOV72923.1 immunoglobulin light chain junction region [Macaca mulatta]MOV73668.1 immunoglobulin light chain junction region [Macaca mulatta]MOV99386.1 immunoglobulin light chain junction region [Macaca mulatta]MOW15797.1 immunoglobulin light chain junction region [Macaca mulatta]